MSKSDKRILVVDDDPDDVFLVREAIHDIEHDVYAVSVANTPEQALEILNTKQFDIILSDYRLGASTGIDLIKDIRLLGNDTPIILLTGMSEREVDEQALAAGASDYLNKSMISGPILDRSIRYAVANARRQQLFSSVLANVKAAICVIDDDSSPQIWNAEFLALAQAGEHASDSEQASVKQFVADVVKRPNQELVDELMHEKKTTSLPDGRMVVTLNDVSEHVKALRERELAENKAAHQAKHCFMTGLPNRMAFSEKLDALIEDGEDFELLIIDLDKFKSVNDIFGHPFGDALLSKVAAAVTSCTSERDFIARIGGDEFVAIQMREDRLANGVKLEDKLLEALADDFIIDGRHQNVGVSVGVASFPAHGKDGASLMSNADVAMYRAKETNGSHVEYYNSDLDNAVRERRRLINDLGVAITDKELDVYFQPQFDLKTGQLIGCEALARWLHPVDGPIRPDIFIALAEESGSIEELGRLILQKACELAKQWPMPLKLAANISGVQVRHTQLVSDVQSILMKTGFPANRLELEVTETVLLDDFDYALHVLRGIKNLGVGLAMDDFGTGFSSLSSLISFPFDKLKIDRSFVMDMEKRQQLKSVIKTCIGLGQNLDLRIVAEGVEQESHIEFLRAEGCDEIQGYLIGRPMPQSQFLEFIEAHKKGLATASDVQPAPKPKRKYA